MSDINLEKYLIASRKLENATSVLKDFQEENYEIFKTHTSLIDKIQKVLKENTNLNIYKCDHCNCGQIIEDGKIFIISFNGENEILKNIAASYTCSDCSW